MGDFLDRITLGQIALTAFLSGLMEWLVDNDIVLWLTFFTLSVSALLALRKAGIVLIRDMEIFKKYIKRKFKLYKKKDLENANQKKGG